MDFNDRIKNTITYHKPVFFMGYRHIITKEEMENHGQSTNHNYYSFYISTLKLENSEGYFVNQPDYFEDSPIFSINVCLDDRSLTLRIEHFIENLKKKYKYDRIKYIKSEDEKGWYNMELTLYKEGEVVLEEKRFVNYKKEYEYISWFVGAYLLRR